ncbi:MAG: arginase family protein [Vicinamibacterales bacterium]
MKPQAVHVIGVPLDLGGGRRGVDMGPSAFRIAGLVERLSSLGVSVIDKGNVPVPGRETLLAPHASKRYIDEIAHVCSDLYASSLASLDEGALPIVLGGDHSLGAGSVAAAAAWARHTKGLPIRSLLGGRAWRHEHTGQFAEWQRARDAARRAPRSRAARALDDWGLLADRYHPSTPCLSASAISMIARRRSCGRPVCTSSR